ncbi:MAG: transposase [Anaerolineales bacterium]|nr:transposase [Anaerolineales bacterium]
MAPQALGRRARYQTKLPLAEQLVRVVVRSGLPIAYLVGDAHSTAGWCTKRVASLGVTWQGALDPKTHVVWRGKRQPGRALAPTLKLKWRKHMGLRAMALRVDAPKYGHIRLVVVKNRHGNWEYLVTNARHADLTTVIERKRSRWSIETVFRDWRSGGFHLDQSGLTDTCRVDRLLMVLAIAYPWLVSVGRWVVKRGYRRMIDDGSARHWHFSLFQLGVGRKEHLVSDTVISIVSRLRVGQ